MPRPSEMTAQGRDDLKQALVRFGGAAKVCRAAGVVPYREWFYFEGQLELLLLLKAYLDQYGDDPDYRVFPCVSDISRRGNDQLHSLITYFGGRKFLAARLGMCHSHIPKPEIEDYRDMNWGPFDLDFGIRLISFVRQEHLMKSPPMRNPVLAMPSQAKLLRSGTGGILLDSQIQTFGGYENVARRLGLAFFD
jgi:hypothetical protein